jgi:hypothetical protein
VLLVGLRGVAACVSLAQPYYGQVRFNLEAARLFGIFARDVADGLTKGPDMALWVHRLVDAIVVELVRRLAQDDKRIVKVLRSRTADPPIF